MLDKKEINDRAKMRMIRSLKWDEHRGELQKVYQKAKKEKCNGGKCVWGMSGVCIRPSCDGYVKR